MVVRAPPHQDKVAEGFQPAVSPIFNRQGGRTSEAPAWFRSGRRLEALRYGVGNLRYTGGRPAKRLEERSSVHVAEPARPGTPPGSEKVARKDFLCNCVQAKLRLRKNSTNLPQRFNDHPGYDLL